MKSTLPLLLLLVAKLSFGSNNPGDREIVLTARPQGGFFKIIVKAPTNDVIQITYMLLDSVSKELKNNTAFFSLLQTRSENMQFETRRALSQKLDSIVEQYRHYTADSITLAADSDGKYQQVFNRFFSSGPEFRPANRFVLDGTSMMITVSDDDTTRTIYAQSPDQASYPQMYEFIKETMNAYRSKKPDGILSKGRTGGY
jgi:cupin superfamily acireductone dioxygenase involved in methionine salvage